MRRWYVAFTFIHSSILGFFHDHEGWTYALTMMTGRSKRLHPHRRTHPHAPHVRTPRPLLQYHFRVESVHRIWRHRVLWSTQEGGGSEELQEHWQKRHEVQRYEAEDESRPRDV
jgi:hypothetical protein